MTTPSFPSTIDYNLTQSNLSTTPSFSFEKMQSGDSTNSSSIHPDLNNNSNNKSSNSTPLLPPPQLSPPLNSSSSSPTLSIPASALLAEPTDLTMNIPRESSTNYYQQDSSSSPTVAVQQQQTNQSVQGQTSYKPMVDVYTPGFLSLPSLPSSSTSPTTSTASAIPGQQQSSSQALLNTGMFGNNQFQQYGGVNTQIPPQQQQLPPPGHPHHTGLLYDNGMSHLASGMPSAINNQLYYPHMQPPQHGGFLGAPGMLGNANMMMNQGNKMRPPMMNRGMGGNQNTVYSFVIPQQQQPKRPRRRYEEIERLYKCNFENCTKAYGTLNHLNAHVTMQKHGPKRVPEEFKDIRRLHKLKKKQEEEARKLENKNKGDNNNNTYNNGSLAAPNMGNNMSSSSSYANNNAFAMGMSMTMSNNSSSGASLANSNSSSTTSTTSPIDEKYHNHQPPSSASSSLSSVSSMPLYKPIQSMYQNYNTTTSMEGGNGYQPSLGMNNNSNVMAGNKFGEEQRWDSNGQESPSNSSASVANNSNNGNYSPSIYAYPSRSYIQPSSTYTSESNKGI